MNSLSSLAKYLIISISSSGSTTNTTVARTVEDVTDFNGLKNAVSKSNVTINIKNDIKFDQAINITGKNITINGDGKNLI